MIALLGALAMAQEVPANVAAAAASMGVPAEFILDVRAGLDRLYQRDYGGTIAHFSSMDAGRGSSSLGPTAEVLVWQAKMLENFDLRYDKEYWSATKRARAALKDELETPGNEAWEHFLMGGVVGIEGMHAAREESYVSSLQYAFEAMDHIQVARELAPDFRDMMLADGIYNYWRTVLTETSKVLPDFGNHKSEGISQMLLVATDGVFLGPPARLSLAFSWIEEHEYARAIETCLGSQATYPDNVINNVLLSRVYIADRKYDDALATLARIEATAPDTYRVHYYRALVYLRTQRPIEARSSLETFLAVPGLDKVDRSNGLLRRGEAYEKEGDPAAAERDYRAAIALDGNDAAKTRLQKLKKKAATPE